MHFYHKIFVSIDIKGFSFQIFGSCFHSAVNFTNFTNHNSLNNFIMHYELKKVIIMNYELCIMNCELCIMTLVRDKK